MLNFFLRNPHRKYPGLKFIGMAAVLTLDADGVTIRSASQALGVLFGYADLEEFIGKPLSTILSPPSFLECLEKTRACSSASKVGRIPFPRHRRHDAKKKKKKKEI